MATATQPTTDIQILGKTYSVRSDTDASFATETAKLVNGKMRELMDKAGALSAEKVAVLTAMNLAGELLQIRKREESIRESLKQKARKLLRLIDSRT
ncbi:MAG TPA: cell division protein ZapA [Bdellovibrionota bacterium]|nr:cell division protein ZapA [Bdellovibrionota bacterium]